MRNLTFTAEKIGTVEAQSSFQYSRPLLAFPCKTSKTVDLVFNAPRLTAQVGDRVEVSYTHEGVFYEFHTAITALPCPQRWRLRLPNAIAYIATRAARRVQVVDDARFSVSLSGEVQAEPLQIYDLSRTGIALALPPGVTLRLEAVLDGMVSVPDDKLIPVRLEVRHVRASPHRRGSIAGCLIRGISPPGRELLLSAIDIADCTAQAC